MFLALNESKHPIVQHLQRQCYEMSTNLSYNKCTNEQSTSNIKMSFNDSSYNINSSNSSKSSNTNNKINSQPPSPKQVLI